MEEGDDQQVQKKVLQSSNLISLFSDLIDSNPLIQDDFPSSSILKLKSVIIGSCLEIEKQFLQLSLLFQQTHQQLIGKIHQLKLKLIQDIEGISSSSSNQQQQQEEKRKCSIEENGLIGIISSFFQKLLQSTSSSSSSSSSDQSQDGMEMKYFDGWNDLDVEIFLEEIGTKKSTIELIKTRLIKSNINNNIIENQQQQNLIGIIKQIYHQLLQSLLESSSSSSKKKGYQEILSNIQQLLPELNIEEKSRLLLGLELISKGFGIINIPNWWMENEIKKPLEERNLMSINNGTESIINWIHLKLPDLKQEDSKTILFMMEVHEIFS